MYIYIYIYIYNQFTPETNTTLSVNYSSKKSKYFFFLNATHLEKPFGHQKEKKKTNAFSYWNLNLRN